MFSHRATAVISDNNFHNSPNSCTAQNYSNRLPRRQLVQMEKDLWWYLTTYRPCRHSYHHGAPHSNRLSTETETTCWNHLVNTKFVGNKFPVSSKQMSPFDSSCGEESVPGRQTTATGNNRKTNFTINSYQIQTSFMTKSLTATSPPPGSMMLRTRGGGVSVSDVLRNCLITTIFQLVQHSIRTCPNISLDTTTTTSWT